jgi:hypothetical protein
MHAKLPPTYALPLDLSLLLLPPLLLLLAQLLLLLPLTS